MCKNICLSVGCGLLGANVERFLVAQINPMDVSQKWKLKIVIATKTKCGKINENFGQQNMRQPILFWATTQRMQINLTKQMPTTMMSNKTNQQNE